MTVFSQTIEPPRSKEVTKYAAEGSECKKILMLRNAQIISKDSAIKLLLKLDSVHVQSDSFYNVLVKELEADNIECNSQYNKLSGKVRRKNSWIKVLLGIALLEGVIIYVQNN